MFASEHNKRIMSRTGQTHRFMCGSEHSIVSALSNIFFRDMCVTAQNLL
jgi:hypothetical protein